MGDSAEHTDDGQSSSGSTSSWGLKFASMLEDDARGKLGASALSWLNRLGSRMGSFVESFKSSFNAGSFSHKKKRRGAAKLTRGTPPASVLMAAGAAPVVAGGAGASSDAAADASLSA